MMMMMKIFGLLGCLTAFACGLEDVVADLEEEIAIKKANVLATGEEFENWLGVHFMFEYMNVSRVDYIRNAEMLEKVVKDAAEHGGLKVIHSDRFQFDQQGEGATLFMILENAHFALHTWPEHRYAAIDVFTCCGVGEDRAKKVAAALKYTLDADTFLGARVNRGIPGKTVDNYFVLSPASIIEDQENDLSDLISGDTEFGADQSLAELWAQRLSERDLEKLFANTQGDFDTLEQHRSQWQTIEFIKNKASGDVCLTLDNTVQICQSYNHQYSEVYVHLPVSYLDSFESALVIGGGDALALDEILKYKSVKRVVQLELDEMVAKLSEKYLGVNAHLPGNPDADPRVEWIFGDAAKTIVDLVENGEQFDLLLLDISETDPSGTVSTMDFFRHVTRALKPTGIFIKNENYQRVTAQLFNEFLEIVYPVPMITQQTFVLGSNKTSLLLPNFKLLEENNVTTSFLARGPTSRFRQLKALVRRYGSKKNMAREVEENIVEDETCTIPKPYEPCALEALRQGAELKQEDWIDGPCTVPPQSENVKLVIRNSSPFPIEILWLPPGKGKSSNAVEKVSIIDNIRPGASKPLNSKYGHSFEIIDKDQAQYEVSLGEFKVTHQHYTHSNIIYKGVQRGLFASVDQVPVAVRVRSRIGNPPTPQDD